MKAITKILGVGGLLAALGSGCEPASYEKDVRSLALVTGWKDFNVQLVQESAMVCPHTTNLYSVEGINPEGDKAIAFACCGGYLGNKECYFLNNQTGGN